MYIFICSWLGTIVPGIDWGLSGDPESNFSPLFQVDTRSNFEWQKQLRYYWDPHLENCVAKMALSTYTYGWEYLGACPRLVITPLTVTHQHTLIDYIHLCLIHALVKHRDLFMLYVECNCRGIEVGSHVVSIFR